MKPVCHCLRWKGYRPTLDPEDAELAFIENRVPYSCLHTAHPWGPDGEPAAPECCTSGRDCYEPASTVVMRVLTRRRERGGGGG